MSSAPKPPLKGGMQSGAPLGFRAWELLVIAAFSAVFVGSFYLYLTDAPVLRTYLLGAEQAGSDQKAGQLRSANGKVRRQKADRAEFESILGGDPVYYNDTLVTGAETGAEIQLDDGGQISLAENTMVKLTFGSKFSLGGVSRQTTVELVQGSLSGSAKSQKIVVRTRAGKTATLSSTSKLEVEQKPIPPVKPVIAAAVPLASPRPEPIVAKILQPPPPPPPPPPPLPSPSPEPKVAKVTASVLTPARGAALALAPNSSARQLSVVLGWRTHPEQARTRVRVYRLGKSGMRDAIDDRMVQSQGGEAALTVVATRPGDYEWVIQERDSEKASGATLARSRFRVQADFEGIELQKALVSGSELQSNQADGKLINSFDGVTLRWRSLPDAQKYKVRIYKGEQELKPVLEKEISEPQYTFNRGKLLQGRFLYRVYALLPGGFIAKSKADAFDFTFLPPSLVQPRNGDRIDSKAPVDGGLPKSVLFTWQKTHFTDFYELEVAQDQEFKRIAVLKKLRENYHAIPLLEPGTYYWRVRSLSQKTKSPPSTANTLIIR